MSAIPLASIKIGQRFRRDMGDIDALARSIEAIGLLHPIVVTPANELICGERRVEAARRLGWLEIPARVVDIGAIVFGEQAENEVRKDFTVSERVAIGRAVEESLGERRGGDRKSEDFQSAKSCTLVEGEKTRDIAAKKSGFGNAETYRQAKAIMESGTPELIEAVDRDDVSISAAAELAGLQSRNSEQSLRLARSRSRQGISRSIRDGGP